MLLNYHIGRLVLVSLCVGDLVRLGLGSTRVAGFSKNKTSDVVTQQHSRNLLMMDILMSETCWVHKKYNKMASDIKLVFYSSVDQSFGASWLGGSNRRVLLKGPHELLWTCGKGSHGCLAVRAPSGARDVYTRVTHHILSEVLSFLGFKILFRNCGPRNHGLEVLWWALTITWSSGHV